MPVFEYKCKKCDSKFEVLHKSTANMEDVICPKCQSKENTKLFSSFAAAVGHSHSSGDSCSSGTCGMAPMGGCPGGMCGLN